MSCWIPGENGCAEAYKLSAILTARVAKSRFLSVALVGLYTIWCCSGAGRSSPAVGAGHARDAASPQCERQSKNEVAVKASGAKSDR